MSTHIRASKGDIAEIVLLPGDPLRAKYIAENFLENPVMYNDVRGMLGFTGFYKGKKISVQGTGMGQPSISIYLNELIRFFDCKTFIRVGSCGTIREEIPIRRVILAQGACSSSQMNRRRFGHFDFAPIADFGLLYKTYNKALDLGIEISVGNVLSEDSFYDDYNRFRAEILKDYGVLAIEMETSELYTLAAKYNCKALSVLTVSDSVLTFEETSAEEREKTFNEMIQLVLESLV